MNKTHQRAIQKHRAKKLKYEIRRKSGADSSGAHAKAGTAGAAARTKPATRRTDTAE
jgi:hypothetical protein